MQQHRSCLCVLCLCRDLVGDVQIELLWPSDNAVGIDGDSVLITTNVAPTDPTNGGGTGFYSSFDPFPSWSSAPESSSSSSRSSGSASRSPSVSLGRVSQS